MSKPHAAPLPPTPWGRGFFHSLEREGRRKRRPCGELSAAGVAVRPIPRRTSRLQWRAGLDVASFFPGATAFPLGASRFHGAVDPLLTRVDELSAGARPAPGIHAAPDPGRPLRCGCLQRRRGNELMEWVTSRLPRQPEGEEKGSPRRMASFLLGASRFVPYLDVPLGSSGEALPMWRAFSPGRQPFAASRRGSTVQATPFERESTCFPPAPTPAPETHAASNPGRPLRCGCLGSRRAKKREAPAVWRAFRSGRRGLPRTSTYLSPPVARRSPCGELFPRGDNLLPRVVEVPRCSRHPLNASRRAFRRRPPPRRKPTLHQIQAGPFDAAAFSIASFRIL
ncbi:hypothetical protein ALCH109712_14415 [Alkalicoccus chagannorensis]